MSVKVILQYVAIGVVTLAVGGCVSLAPGPGETENQIRLGATAFNNALARATNDQILLNILRARDRRPHYVSSIQSTTLSNQLSSSAGLGATVPVGSSQSNFPLAPSISFGNAANPSTSISGDHDKAFFQAYLQPIAPELFEYFFNLGFPRQTVAHLLIQKVEDCEGTRQECIEKFLTDFSKPSSASEQSTGVELAETPSLTEQETPTANTLSLVSASTEPDDKCQYFSNAKEVELAMNAESAGFSIFSNSSDNTKLPLKLCKSQASPSVTVTRSASGESAGKIQLRSLEGIIYALGQMARYERYGERTSAMYQAPNVPNSGSCKPRASVPLFLIETVPENSDDYTAIVNYRGQTYAAGYDDGCDSATNTVLTIVSSLFALTEERKELPRLQSIVVN